jgi:hypothetical protein
MMVRPDATILLDAMTETPFYLASCFYLLNQVISRLMLEPSQSAGAKLVPLTQIWPRACNDR